MIVLFLLGFIVGVLTLHICQIVTIKRAVRKVKKAVAAQRELMKSRARAIQKDVSWN